ncbi:MAG: hypothetical protein NTW19_22335 [Planctomycetota bacterium]|nr:hypothetical protein [Planctomycetota bacterium]
MPLAAREALGRLRAVILLGGSVRTGRLASSIGRSVLDLPVEEKKSVLDLWQAQAAHLASMLGLRGLPVRVFIDQASEMPRPARSVPEVNVQLERDPLDFRGTAGVLHDHSRVYEANDLMLVGNAAQILLEPLPDLAAGLVLKGGAVSLVAHDDGIPSGLMLIRRDCLDDIKPMGFVDLKEQALPAIAAKHGVGVMRRSSPTGLPIRTLDDYISALQHYHRRLAGIVDDDPMAEEWRTSFSLVEEGATVAPGARVHDSVVLRGGRLEKSAVAVHSVICPGGVVPAGGMAVNQVVAGPDVRPSRSQA